MRFVIVGGVAAGMSAAARARRLDESAEIIVLERGEYVSYASCGLPYYVGGEISDQRELSVQTPGSLKASLNLDIRPRHNVIGLDAKTKTLTVDADGFVSQISYDELLLAPGTVALRPDIKGLDSPRVRTLRSIPDALDLEAMTRRATSVVVLGAGFIGLEVAESLRRRGLTTTVVERASHPLPPIEPEVASLVNDELRRLGIDVRVGVAATEIISGRDHDTVILDDGTQVDAHLIVLAVGVRPDTEIFADAGVACERGYITVNAHGRTNLPHVWAAGDATMGVDAITGQRRPIALAGPAQRAGRLVSDAIFSPDAARPIPAFLGTAVVRVGEQTVAMTGANRRSLNDAGITFTTIHLHPNDHAGYYPGAQPMHLIVHVEKGTNRLLGAQGVGKAGVERRIDVVSTAMRSGLSALDLIDEDLAYSPIYGQAKDAVNLIGMIAENVATGRLTLWEASDIREVMKTHLILDARRPDEFATGHVPGALNIPHTELRGRVNEVVEVASGRPVAVMCAAGVRSYIAHRILVDAGMTSTSLSGGIQTLRAVLALSDPNLLVTERN